MKLGLAPLFDDVTEYSRLWMERLAGKLTDCDVLAPELCLWENVESEIPEYDEVLFYDHGNEDALIGQDMEPLIDKSKASYFAGKVLYTMACLAAKGLGPEIFKAGGIFVGYYEEFAFVPDDEELFCEAAGSGMIAYEQGERDWDKIDQAMTDSFNAQIAKAQDEWTKTWLQHDRDIKRIYAPEKPPTESTCFFRRAALRLFGLKWGWKVFA